MMSTTRAWTARRLMLARGPDVSPTGRFPYHARWFRSIRAAVAWERRTSTRLAERGVFYWKAGAARGDGEP